MLMPRPGSATSAVSLSSTQRPATVTRKPSLVASPRASPVRHWPAGNTSALVSALSQTPPVTSGGTGKAGSNAAGLGDGFSTGASAGFSAGVPAGFSAGAGATGVETGVASWAAACGSLPTTLTRPRMLTATTTARAARLMLLLFTGVPPTRSGAVWRTAARMVQQETHPTSGSPTRPGSAADRPTADWRDRGQRESAHHRPAAMVLATPRGVESRRASRQQGRRT
jgi:hypothetical protein